MGWTEYSIYGNSRKEIKRELISEFNDPKHKIIDASLVGNEFYAFVSYVENDDAIVKYYILCVMWSIKKTSHGRYDLSYKSMSASDGPCIIKCPLKYIKLMDQYTLWTDPSVDDKGFTRNWRQRVLERSRVSLLQQLVNKCPHNTRVTFDGIVYRIHHIENNGKVIDVRLVEQESPYTWWKVRKRDYKNIKAV